MHFDFENLEPGERYKLLTATVVPRPIALVSTRTPEGRLNAAPFSFFNIFSEDPALAVLGLESRRDTMGLKDTTRNIIETGELVINLVDLPMADAMAACAADLPPDSSEFEFSGLTPVPSRNISVPGIMEAPVRLECTLFEMRRLTERRHLCIAEIVAIDIRDGLVDPERMRVDTAAYVPLGRLHGNSYFAINESFELKVPASGDQAQKNAEKAGRALEK